MFYSSVFLNNEAFRISGLYPISRCTQIIIYGHGHVRHGRKGEGGAATPGLVDLCINHLNLLLENVLYLAVKYMSFRVSGYLIYRSHTKWSSLLGVLPIYVCMCVSITCFVSDVKKTLPNTHN